MILNSLIRVLIMLVVLIGSAPIVRAQEVVQNAAKHAAPAPNPGLAVEENDALVDFPEGITFTLDAETADPIVNLEFMYRAPGVETFSVELPPFNPGTTEIALEHTVEFLYQPDPPPSGIDILYRWRITESDGDTIETPEYSVPWIDGRFDWTPLIGPNVTVYGYDGDLAFQQEILDTAERTITRLSEAYGAKLEQRVRIWAYSDRENYSSSLPPSFVQWTAGFNRPDLHVIDLVLPSGDQDEVKRVVPHEVSHQILYQATNNPFSAPPDWLEEGLATYSQESGRDRLYDHALKLAALGEVPPLRTLNGGFAYQVQGGEAGASYALSLTVVTYIVDTWGDEGMARLITSFGEGVTHEDAVQQGLGISFDELDRGWHEYLAAAAQNQAAVGSTRFGDDTPASPWSTIGEGLALASGTIVLGLVVLLALIAGLVSLIRSRRRRDDEEPALGVRWGEWPEGLEPPGWRAESAGQP